jgi:hypothetical protein
LPEPEVSTQEPFSCLKFTPRDPKALDQTSSRA